MEIITDWTTGQPTDRPTKQRTGRRDHREVNVCTLKPILFLYTIFISSTFLCAEIRSISLSTQFSALLAAKSLFPFLLPPFMAFMVDISWYVCTTSCQLFSSSTIRIRCFWLDLDPVFKLWIRILGTIVFKKHSKSYLLEKKTCRKLSFIIYFLRKAIIK